MASSRFAVINGLRLHYREAGPEAGPPVFVLHGIMGHAHEWDHLMDALSGRFRVIATDARGHGESQWADDYAAEPMVGDLVGLLRHLWKALDLVQAPTLVVRGAQSDVLSAATAEQMTLRLADGTLCEIPDAGHDIGVEQPAAVAAAVRSFLQSAG